MPASDEGGFSRRGLFRFGLDRIAPKEPDPPPRPPVAASADPADQPERWRATREGFDGGALGVQIAQPLLEALGPGMGDRVLDAGAGEGRLAELAWEIGAQVTALEPAAAVRERGRELVPDVEWAGGELERLPFGDASFDHAVSAFGPSSSRAGSAVLSELFRVVRPGGSVAIAGWRPGGAIGKLLRLADAVDALPDGVHPPLAWGREDRLRSEMRDRGAGASYDTVELKLRFDGMEEAIDAVCAGLVPLAAALAALPEGDRAGLRAEVGRLVAEHAEADPAGDGQLVLRPKVLVVVADRP